MESKEFATWFEKKFIPHCNKSQNKKILFVDGHNSHISIEVVLLAIKNYISLICLPPHSTHLLQPLDVGVFKSVKNSWRKLIT